LEETDRRPKARMHATDAFVLVLILRFQRRAMGNNPRIQSATNETTEWAILASGTAAGLIQ
jgi:hypothetical protein